MHISKRSTIVWALVVGAVGTAIACERVGNPNAPLVNGVPSFMNRAPAFVANGSARVTEIEGRLRSAKDRGLTPQELVLVKHQRARWKWVGVMHHQAMQEALGDQSIKGLNSASARCAARARYGMKYAATGQHPLPEAYRVAVVRSVNDQFDTCLTLPPGRIFSLQPPAGMAEGEQIRADTLGAQFIDYTYALGNQLGRASSLQDANNVVNAFIVTINNDATLTSIARDALYAAASLAYSSAAEWDAFYLGDGTGDSHQWEMSLFVWGWLSSVGKWVSDVVKGDVYGCGYGMVGVFLFMADAHITMTLPEFGQTMAYACGAGGITGSVLAAF